MDTSQANFRLEESWIFFKSQLSSLVPSTSTSYISTLRTSVFIPFAYILILFESVVSLSVSWSK